jgi:solute carrier family 30 (zinc transporter), member 9
MTSNAPVGLSSALYAFSGNFFIAILKTFGFLVSGSASLFGEAIHSFADSLNQAFLLLGIHLSKKTADDSHAYGYGSERFLWALISACGVFFVGAGVTIYHGINALLHAYPAEITSLVFGILFISFIVESFTLYIAYSELRKSNKDLSFSDSLTYGDPVTVAIVYEDTAAVVGVIVATLGVALTYWTGDGRFDAWGSIGVGCILAVISVILINKNRQYLLGKAIPEDIKERVLAILESDPYIDHVIDFKSEVLDIGKYHVKCEIEFNGAALLEEIIANDDIREDYESIKDDYEAFKKFIVYHTNRVPRLIGRKIDEIEHRIILSCPQIKHLDIEIN